MTLPIDASAPLPASSAGPPSRPEADAGLGLLVAVANGATLLASLVQIVAVGHRFGMASAGVLTLCYSIATPVFLAAGLNIRSIQASAQSLRWAPALLVRLRSSLLLIAGGAFAVIAWLAAGGRSSGAAPVVAAVLAIRVLEQLADMAWGRMLQQERLGRFAGSLLLRSILSVVFFAAATMLGADLGTCLGAWAAGALISFMLIDRPMLTGDVTERTALRVTWASLLWRDPVDRSEAAALIRTVSVLASAILLSSLAANTPRFLVASVGGHAQLGLFAIPSYFTTAFAALVTAHGLPASQRLCRGEAAAHDGYLRRLVAGHIGVALLLMAAHALLVGSVLPFLLPVSSPVERIVVSLCVGAGVLQGLAGLLTIPTLYRAPYPVQILLSGTECAVVLFTGLLLIPRFGGIGAALSLGLTAALKVSLQVRLLTRRPSAPATKSSVVVDAEVVHKSYPQHLGDEFTKQWWLHRALGEVALSPEPLTVDPTRSTISFRRLPPFVAFSALPRTRLSERALLGTVGVALRRLHDAPNPFTQDPRTVTALDGVGARPAPAPLLTRTVLLHGDFGMTNIGATEGGQVVILDASPSGFPTTHPNAQGSAIVDLAQITAGVSGLLPLRPALFADAIGNARSVAEGYLDRPASLRELLFIVSQAVRIAASYYIHRVRGGASGGDPQEAAGGEPSRSYAASHGTSRAAARYADSQRAGYWETLFRIAEEPLLRAVLRRRVPATAVVVDVACGYGRISAALRRDGRPVLGSDIAREMLLRASDQVVRGYLVQADARRLPLQSGSVTAATLFRFLLNAEPALRQSTLEEIRRCLAPGGTLVANVHVARSSPLGLAYRTARRFRRFRMLNALGPEDATAELRRAGFRVDEIIPYGLMPRPGRWYPPRIARLQERLEAWLAGDRKGRGRWAQCYLIVATADAVPPRSA